MPLKLNVGIQKKHGDGQFEALTNHLFGKPASELSCLEASNLIVVLQDLKAGRLDLEAALDRAA